MAEGCAVAALEVSLKLHVKYCPLNPICAYSMDSFLYIADDVDPVHFTLFPWILVVYNVGNKNI